MVLAWEAIEAQRFFQVLLNPGGEPGIFACPPRQPGGQIVKCFRQIAAGVEPAQFLQAIVIDFAWYIVQGVAQKMDIATLPDGLRQDFANGRPKSRMIVGDHQFHAVQPACLKSAQDSLQLERLSRLASSTPRIWRRPSQSIPIAISTAWLTITTASRTCS